MNRHTYVFDNTAPQAPRRFESLEVCYDAASIARLRALGVAPGWHCLEVGGGGGSIARWLADQVGECGHVLATDIAPDHLGVAGPNLELCQHDIVTDPLPSARFDLVHARLVLLHLAEREYVLRRTLETLRPGGWLLLDEFDLTWLPVLRAPSSRAVQAFTTVTTGVHTLVARAGGDPQWGTHAYRSLVTAGFVNTSVRVHAQSWTLGRASAGAQLHRANAMQVQSQLLSSGLVTESELQDFLDLLDTPEAVVLSYPLISTWGQRPGEDIGLSHDR